MKIIYLHQYFKTPEQGGAVRSFHLAKAMVNAGHQVDMITSHNREEYMIEMIEGIRVHYLPVAYSNYFGFIKRLWSFFKFAFLSYRLAKKITTDVIYATSTPLTVGWTALRLNKKNATPYIFEVRDLWPLAPKELGIINNRLFIKIAERLERKIYLRADNVIALSPSMKTHIASIISSDKIKVIPNFSNNQLAKNHLKAEKKSSEKFRIAYAGAMGHVNDIPFLLKLIHLVDSKFSTQIELVFMGEGKFSDQIKTACEKSISANYLGFLPKQKVFDQLASTDANLTTFLPYQVLESNSPNKFFDGLAMQNIALINFGGWIEDLIQTHQIGYRLGKETLEDDLKTLLKNSTQHQAQKENAKLLATTLFDMNNSCFEIVDLIKHKKGKNNPQSIKMKAYSKSKLA